MDQKLLAALRTLTANDFAIIYGPGMLNERLFTRFQGARETNDLQLYLLSLTADQQSALANYLKVLVKTEMVEIQGTATQLYDMSNWFSRAGLPYFVKNLEVMPLSKGADFTLLVSQGDYEAYINHLRHVHAA